MVQRSVCLSAGLVLAGCAPSQPVAPAPRWSSELQATTRWVAPIAVAAHFYGSVAVDSVALTAHVDSAVIVTEGRSPLVLRGIGIGLVFPVGQTGMDVERRGSIRYSVLDDSVSAGHPLVLRGMDFRIGRREWTRLKGRWLTFIMLAGALDSIGTSPALHPIWVQSPRNLFATAILPRAAASLPPDTASVTLKEPDLVPGSCHPTQPQGQSGGALVQITVDTLGHVSSIKPLESHGNVSLSALPGALAGCLFTPARFNGRPVSMIIQQPIEFH